MDDDKDQVRVGEWSEAMIWGHRLLKPCEQRGKVWLGVGMLVCHWFLDLVMVCCSMKGWVSQNQIGVFG